MQTNIETPNGIPWVLNQRLNDLDYADSICLIAHAFSDVQQKINRLVANVRYVGLSIIVSNT